MAKMWNRRFLSITALTVAASLSITACSGDNGNKTNTGGADKAGANKGQGSNVNTEGEMASSEPITMKMMGYKHPIHGPWEEMIFFKEMEKRTNIKFVFDTPPSEGYEEKKNLAFASGEVPDVFFGANLTPGEEIKYGSQGVLLPLEDLIEEHAPNIKAMFEEMPDVKQSVTTPDGHIYALPHVNKASIAVAPTTWVNGDWLNNLNITELPTTVEGLYELLKNFKDNDANKNGQADEIPLGTNNKMKDFHSVILPAFGVWGREVYVDDDGKVHYGAMTDGYKAYLQFMNRLWKEKLVDPASYTDTFTEMSAKGKENKVGMFVHAAPFLGFKVDKPEDNLKYPVLPALSSDINPTNTAAISAGIVRGVFAITSQNPDPVRTIQWVDYLYSKEGSIFVHYGPEGDLWEYADKEKGLRKYIEPANGMNTEEYRGTLTPDVGTPLPKWVRPEVERGWDDVGHEHRFKETEEKIMPHARLPFPLIYFTAEEQDQIDVISTDLKTYLDSMEAKFITGQESFDKWDNFINTLKKMNIEQYVEINQAAYDRWKAAN
ncbi:extracellular solute-binding protein [Paenibacillus sp. GCM10027626]|uniref:extracellular solute-binding protein n=1 Tax=Paenibacillus sp. GCM10027626 TaxID=3273411 RepID=UPI0036429628